jgi:hypothetical protein
VSAGVYSDGVRGNRRTRDVPELGRRIEVDWDPQGMPEGKVAKVQPRSGPLSRRAIREIPERVFADLVATLGDPGNWVELGNR